MRIVKFPTISNISQDVQKHLQKYLLSFVIRMQQRQNSRFWKSEIVFVGNPVAKIHKNRQVTTLAQDVGSFENTGEIVDQILTEWTQMVHLFELVDDFEDYLLNESISDMIDIKTYNFKDLVLEYGPNHKSTVKVKWNGSKQKFSLTFGGIEENSGEFYSVFEILLHVRILLNF